MLAQILVSRRFSARDGCWIRITMVAKCGVHTASFQPVWWLRATASARKKGLSGKRHRKNALDVHVRSPGRCSVAIKTDLVCETVAS